MQKMKRFKRYINEELAQAEFNNFVEQTVTKNQISANSAPSFLTDQYNYKGVLYKVLFFPEAEIMNLAEQDGTPNRKMITSYLAKSNRLNPDQYKFYCKSIQGLESLIKTPGLFKTVIDQGGQQVTLMGVVFSIDAKASIDLCKYSGDNIEVKERLAKTNEVLSFDDLTIKNIDALYYMADNGWYMETDLDEPLFEPGEETTIGAEEDEDGNIVDEEPPHDMSKFK